MHNDKAERKINKFHSSSAFHSGKIRHYRTLEKVKEGVKREGCATVSLIQLLVLCCVMSGYIPFEL